MQGEHYTPPADAHIVESTPDSYLPPHNWTTSPPASQVAHDGTVTAQNAAPLLYSQPSSEYPPLAPELAQFGRDNWARTSGLDGVRKQLDYAAAESQRTGVNHKGEVIPDPLGQKLAAESRRTAKYTLDAFTSAPGYSPEVVTAARALLSANFPTSETPASPSSVQESSGNAQRRIAGNLGEFTLRSSNLLARLPEAVSKVGRYASKFGAMAIKAAQSVLKATQNISRQ